MWELRCFSKISLEITRSFPLFICSATAQIKGIKSYVDFFQSLDVDSKEIRSPIVNNKDAKVITTYFYIIAVL